jgi:hypothetical protein
MVLVRAVRARERFGGLLILTHKENKPMAEETLATAEEDVFAGSEPIAGREKLGRVIRDKDGHLSGSPANYEATRGLASNESVAKPLSEDQEAELLGWLEEQLPVTE